MPVSESSAFDERVLRDIERSQGYYCLLAAPWRAGTGGRFASDEGGVYEEARLDLATRAVISFLKTWALDMIDFESDDIMRTVPCPIDQVSSFLSRSADRLGIRAVDAEELAGFIINGVLANRSRAFPRDDATEAGAVRRFFRIIERTDGGVALHEDFLKAYAHINDIEEMLGERFDYDAYILQRKMQAAEATDDEIIRALEKMERDMRAEVTGLRARARAVRTDFESMDAEGLRREIDHFLEILGHVGSDSFKACVRAYLERRRLQDEARERIDASDGGLERISSLISLVMRDAGALQLAARKLLDDVRDVCMIRLSQPASKALSVKDYIYPLLERVPAPGISALAFELLAPACLKRADRSLWSPEAFSCLLQIRERVEAENGALWLQGLIDDPPTREDRRREAADGLEGDIGAHLVDHPGARVSTYLRSLDPLRFGELWDLGAVQTVLASRLAERIGEPSCPVSCLDPDGVVHMVAMCPDGRREVFFTDMIGA